MKHLIILYNIYFIMIMIVPCNHIMLYSNLAKNIFGVQLADNQLQNPHHHKQDSTNSPSDSHCPCTPCCVCGITTFVLNIPPVNFFFYKNTIPNLRKVIYPENIWVVTPNLYSYLMTNEIWHPPQQV